MRKITKRSAAIAAAAVVAVGAAGAAYAVNGWGVGGTGTAEATTSAIVPMTATINLGTKLYPGLKADAIAKVTNTNNFPVILDTAVTALPATVSVTGANAAACKAALLAPPSPLTLGRPGRCHGGRHPGRTGRHGHLHRRADAQRDVRRQHHPPRLHLQRHQLRLI
jgi:hypothetical protein